MTVKPAVGHKMSQVDCLEKAVGGDSAAMQTLLVLHAETVRGYIGRHLPPLVAAVYEPEDVLQDVYMEACRRIEEFSSGHIESFLPWLQTITRHHMIVLLRKVRSQKRGGGRAAITRASGGLEDVVRLLESLAIFYRTPSLSAMSHETVAAVQASMDRLSPDHREAIRLRHIEGLGAQEAAVLMKRTEGAFHLLCNRGLKKLREDLQSKSYFV